MSSSSTTGKELFLNSVLTDLDEISKRLSTLVSEPALHRVVGAMVDDCGLRWDVESLDLRVKQIIKKWEEVE